MSDSSPNQAPRPWVTILGYVLATFASIVVALIYTGNMPFLAPGSNSATVVASSPVPSTTAPAIELKITNPVHLGTIKLEDTVSVTVKNAPSKARNIWILIHFANDPAIYPVGPCDYHDEGTSVCPGQFGDKGNQGQLLDLTAALVNPEDNLVYDSYAENGYSSLAPPVTPLAESDTITVERA